MKEPNEIDVLFQSAFDGLELTPDPSVKENIDRVIASKKKRRRFLFILFPIFFGTASLATVGYFYSFQENPVQNKSLAAQNQLSQHKQNFSSPVSKSIRPDETRQSTLNNRIPEINSGRKQTVKKNYFKTGFLPTNPKSIEQPKTKSTFLVTGKTVSLSEQTRLPVETNKQQPVQSSKTLEKHENKLITKQDSVTDGENNPDSIAISALPYSTGQIIPEISKSPESSKGAGKWSLSLLSYWEGEKKRRPDPSDQPFTGNKKETARIHSSTFYVKLEVNRKLNTQLEVLTGIGFRSSQIIQYGNLSTIETSIDNLVSGGSQSITVYDTIHSTEVQSFRVNSIVLPIGFAYSFPIGKKMQIRLSAGGEFAYGQLSKKHLQPELSAPSFRSFGSSVWLRPEIHYSLGKTQLFGFGTFNQSLYQQLKWDFESRRNPAFGAGIGWRIYL